MHLPWPTSTATKMLSVRHLSLYLVEEIRRWTITVSVAPNLRTFRYHLNRMFWFSGNFVESYWGKSFPHDCFYDSRCLKTNTTRWQPTARAWRWQKCSELAYFQVAPEKGSLRPQAVNFTYHINQCKDVFSLEDYQGPSTDEINDRFGGADPRKKNASRIFYTNGSDDPWKMAAVRKNLSDTLLEYTAVCDGCGHCRDLSTPSAHDPQAIVQQRVFVADTFQRWLDQKS